MEPTTNRISNKNPQRNTLILAIIVGVAVIAAGAVILLTSNTQTVTTGSYEDIPFSRQPDGGFVLGHPDARVTIVEYADFA